MTDPMTAYLVAAQINQQGGRGLLAQWINEAEDYVERGIRKNAAFVYMYGRSSC